MAQSPGLLTLQQRLLLEHFLGCRGIPLACGRVIAVLYGSDWDGGPEDAPAAARMHIVRLRQRLKPHGIDILTIGIGRGAQGWMVEPEHYERLRDLMRSLPDIDVELARWRATWRTTEQRP